MGLCFPEMKQKTGQTSPVLTRRLNYLIVTWVAWQTGKQEGGAKVFASHREEEETATYREQMGGILGDFKQLI